MFLLTETLRFLVATAIDDGNNFSLTHMRTCAIWFGACFDDCPLKMSSSHNCTAFTSHSLRNEHVNNFLNHFKIIFYWSTLTSSISISNPCSIGTSFNFMHNLV
ncbi:unnamed protein product [Rhizophagus irregularis]|nr:unnamed protein product [Rhizophagus irregularis]